MENAMLIETEDTLDTIKIYMTNELGRLKRLPIGDIVNDKNQEQLHYIRLGKIATLHSLLARCNKDE